MPGHNDWIKFDGINCSLDFSQLQILSKKEAIAYNIQKITERFGNLFVCLSGGIDSEFAAECLLENGVKFTPVILDHGYNDYEKWYAYKFCYDNQLIPKEIKIKQSAVLKIFPSISKKHQGSTVLSSSVILAMYEINKVDGKLIVGGAEPFDRIAGNDDCLDQINTGNLDFNSYDFILDIYGHPSGFINYPPELYFNFISELDYSKPVQLAMSEYYGVIPRPKFHVSRDMQNRNSNLREYFGNSSAIHFDLGHKDDFLKKCLNREKIRIVGTNK